MLTLTLQFATPAEAIEALSRLTVQGEIAFADRPDVGFAPLLPLLPVQFAPGVDPAQVFGGSAVVPVPPPTPAPSTVVAAASPTAPVALPPGPPMPPPAAAPSAPSPAPAASVPTAPAAPTSPAGGVEVDADGLPWDQRIHAANRGKNTDGRWRQKRGLNDEALKKRIEAELRQAMSAPGAPPPPPVAPAVPVPPPAPAAVIPPAPAAVIPPAPPVPPAPVVETFGTLMARLGPPMATGKLSMQRVCEILAPFGLTAPAQLAARPDLVPLVSPVIDDCLKALV